MTHSIIKSLVACVLIALSFSCHTQSSQRELPPEDWPDITREAKPWTRWWWMGNAVDEKNIGQLLETYQDVGLGGVEIAPIYGAKGYEDRYLDFLSEEWLNLLKFTVEKAKSLDMGVDLTQGTGWPFGGPQVTEDAAASRILIQEYQISDGKPLNQAIVFEKRGNEGSNPALMAVMAYGANGESKEITQHLSPEGNLNWSAEGDWQIKAIFLGKTGQKVKRAAPGGEGFTLDHYSKKAVDDYLKYFDEAFQGNPPNFRAFYNDSFEVYGADFTADFFNVFKAKSGYDLKDKLPLLTRNDSSENSIRVKSDYRETIHELLLENFTENWTDQAHNLGKLTKNQAHGSPGNLLDLYAAVDIPEGETFGSSYFPIPGLRRDSADIRNVDPDPIMLKFASSAAHLSGKNLVSCETFTWLGEHFKSSFAQMKPEVEQAFLAGVNHIFYHGVTYSPEDVPFPGWLFYASLNLTQQNSLWPHFKSFNDYIARCQSVLQSGKSDNEILMYWPVYDVWANPDGMMEILSVHHINKWLHPTDFYKQSSLLMEKGYGVDFISDQILSGSEAENGEISTHQNSSAAKVLVIPETQFMPLSTLENILRLAREGATVVFQTKPKSTPGLSSVQKDQEEMEQLWNQLGLDDQNRQISWEKGKILLSENLIGSLESIGIHREKLTDSGLKFIRRALPDQKYYYLVNHGPDTIDQDIPLNFEAETVVLMNPVSGKTGQAKSHKSNGSTMVKVKLLPGESMILKALGTTSPNAGRSWNYPENLEDSLNISGPWELEFNEGGPEIPQNHTLDQIQVWTDLDDDAANHFSGQATYSSSFVIEELKPMEYILNFENVHESVKVWINEQYAGQVWSIPYQISIGDFLQKGENKIRLEVANLMANRIRYMDQEGQEWRNYHEINFVNIDYEAFDASNWEVMASGIKGPVSIHSYSILSD